MKNDHEVKGIYFRLPKGLKKRLEIKLTREEETMQSFLSRMVDRFLNDREFRDYMDRCKEEDKNA